MRRKANKIAGGSAKRRSPPKAKVVRSNRIGCATLPLPQLGQVVEIPPGFEVVEGFACENFIHRRTQFIRQTDGSSLELYLKSRRSGNHRSRSA